MLLRLEAQQIFAVVGIQRVKKLLVFFFEKVEIWMDDKGEGRKSLCWVLK